MKMTEKYKIIHNKIKDDYVIQKFINKGLGYTVVSIKKTIQDAMNFIPNDAEVSVE